MLQPEEILARPVYRLGFDIIYHPLLKYPDPYPAHERVVRAVIQDYWADVPVLLPSDIASELREYERTSRVS